MGQPFVFRTRIQFNVELFSKNKAKNYSTFLLISRTIKSFKNST